jgi:formylglycine-generating enzyme
MQRFRFLVGFVCLLLLAAAGAPSCSIEDDASKHRCLSDDDCVRGRSCSSGYCRDRLSALGGSAGTDDGGSAGSIATGGDGGRPSGGAGSGGVGAAGGSGAANASGGARPAQGGAGEGGAGESGAGQSGSGESGAGEGGAGAGSDCPAMVRTDEGFCIDATEVTRAAYQGWLDEGPAVAAADGCQSDASFDPYCDWEVDGDLPATCVDWCDAEAFCRAAGKHLCGRIGGGSASYDTDYDDASASEWFAACSSGGKYDYPYGDTYAPRRCEESGFIDTTSATICHAPSAPYDCIVHLSGNVREWDDSCTDATEAALCRLRGGGYRGAQAPSDFACVADAAATRTGAPVSTYVGVGFRCCADSCP